MVNNKQITEMVKKILNHSQGLQDHKIMHPERDWLIGLSMVLVIFVTTGYHSVYTYWKSKNLTASQDVSSTDGDIVYRETMIKDALSRFDARNKEREVLVSEFSKNTPPLPVEISTSTAPQASTTPEQEPSERVVNSGQ